MALGVPLVISSTDTEINLWAIAWETTDFFLLPVKNSLQSTFLLLVGY